MGNTFLSIHEKIASLKIANLFTWFTRILLSLAFIPSGFTKIMGNRFTLISIDNPIGFFFEALYRSGWYWNFLGFMQLFVAVFLLIPKTTFAAAIIYFPIIINIFFITLSLKFTGTPLITGFMLIANIYLLLWDYPKLKQVTSSIFK